uniref:Uncharacterized protein n=1 Tax=Rhizophora mucronata TaxID=61149 RepID=A0A2P2NQ46_RHIMU
MLFHIKRPRIQSKAPTKDLKLCSGQSPGHEPANGQDGNLHEDGRDGEWLGTVGEESVEED